MGVAAAEGARADVAREDGVAEEAAVGAEPVLAHARLAAEGAARGAHGAAAPAAEDAAVGAARERGELGAVGAADDAAAEIRHAPRRWASGKGGIGGLWRFIYG